MISCLREYQLSPKGKARVQKENFSEMHGTATIKTEVKIKNWLAISP
jgi:hypothetical protein